ncbi:unnamed protein product [Rhizophagus irregularis]|nr:unnamed protein product [Rhizophagus irregularis]
MYNENKKKQLSKVGVIREETFHKRPPSGPLTSQTLKSVKRQFFHSLFQSGTQNLGGSFKYGILMLRNLVENKLLFNFSNETFTTNISFFFRRPEVSLDRQVKTKAVWLLWTQDFDDLDVLYREINSNMSTGIQDFDSETGSSLRNG